MSPLVLNQSHARSAFTLLEMLVVLAVMGILIYLASPGIVALQQTSSLSLAGQSVVDEISVAREMAASRNVVVEIRFLTPSNWSVLGSPNYTGYHAIQLWAPNESGASVPVDRVITLPDGVEISSHTTLSPLLSTLVAASASMPAGSTVGTYVSFFVRPNGTIQVANPPTDTAGSTQDNASVRAPSYFFTIVSVRYDTASIPPANYFTLQVNPDTGRSEAYRP